VGESRATDVGSERPRNIFIYTGKKSEVARDRLDR
jgi:hypothetical protein